MAGRDDRCVIPRGPDQSALAGRCRRQWSPRRDVMDGDRHLDRAGPQHLGGGQNNVLGMLAALCAVYSARCWLSGLLVGVKLTPAITSLYCVGCARCLPEGLPAARHWHLRPHTSHFFTRQSMLRTSLYRRHGSIQRSGSTVCGGWFWLDAALRNPWSIIGPTTPASAGRRESSWTATNPFEALQVNRNRPRCYQTRSATLRPCEFEIAEVTSRLTANIAEYYDIPRAAPHCFPARIKFLPRVPYRPEPNSPIPTRPTGRTDPAGSARHTSVV